ncbi:hypothetical protein HZS_1353 [Henneguya salminicola]|nr:hypothetical protein HZS_1353 [Henneguya salminicola]
MSNMYLSKKVRKIFKNFNLKNVNSKHSDEFENNNINNIKNTIPDSNTEIIIQEPKSQRIRSSTVLFFFLCIKFRTSENQVMEHAFYEYLVDLYIGKSKFNTTNIFFNKNKKTSYEPKNDIERKLKKFFDILFYPLEPDQLNNQEILNQMNILKNDNVTSENKEQKNLVVDFLQEYEI